MNSKERIEELREYSRNYYWKNRQRILEKQRQQAEESKISKSLNRSWLIMLDEWRENLTKRLENDNVQGWLRLALEMMISKIDERKQTLQKDRQPGL